MRCFSAMCKHRSEEESAKAAEAMQAGSVEPDGELDGDDIEELEETPFEENEGDQGDEDDEAEGADQPADAACMSSKSC